VSPGPSYTTTRQETIPCEKSERAQILHAAAISVGLKKTQDDRSATLLVRRPRSKYPEDRDQNYATPPAHDPGAHDRHVHFGSVMLGPDSVQKSHGRR
jgi:hypothetical protein